MKNVRLFGVVSLCLGLLAVASPARALTPPISETAGVFGWGDNSQGQLGDGTTTDRSTPVMTAPSDVWMSVAAGAEHSIAMKHDGTMWAWGDNSQGQLGDGTTTDRLAPVQIGTGTTWDAVAAGNDFSLALKEDGTMWAWGNNFDGQLGDGTTTDRLAPVQVGSATTWVQVAAGNDHSMALKDDGTLWAWGNNLNGQLGDGTITQRTAPVQIGTGTTWAYASAGNGHSLALKEDGTMWAWGLNLDGQLGDGSITPRLSPVQIGSSTNWDLVAAGDGHSLGVMQDGTLWAWGNNFDGELGDGTTTDRLSPVRVGSEVSWYDVDAGGSHSQGVRAGVIPKTFATPNPEGAFDSASAVPGGIQVAGWALDPNTSDPIGVHVYVGNVFAGALVADDYREDIDSLYEGYGGNHGYNGIVPAAQGPQSVCTYAINEGVGTNMLIGCKNVSVALPDSPIGSFDAASIAPGGVRVAGWALDSQTKDPIVVHAYVDNVFVGAFDADESRPDVAAAFNGYGKNHGFEKVIPASGGAHTICTYGINVGLGANSLIGCRSVTVIADPIGSFDAATPTLDGVNIQGWALDPFTTDPIVVHIYVDNTFVGGLDADMSRPDVGGVFPGLGNDHGFDHFVPVAPGPHTICTYGINVGPGNNSLISCRQVTVPTDPFGSFDIASFGSGGLRIAGWAIDPSTDEPIVMHVYVDGQIVAAFDADATRTDVGQIFADYGDDHGFDVDLPVTPGIHTVCVYGINVGLGNNSLIGCRSTS